MKKENFMREIALLKEDGDSFGFVLDGNTQKGIVIFVVPDCDSESENAMEYMIEGNNIVEADKLDNIYEENFYELFDSSKDEIVVI